MQDVLSYVSQIQRPNLLVKAARIGAKSYQREKHLRRTLKSDTLPKSGASLLRLTEMEADLNHQRVAKDATYSVTRHVAVLTALVGEARLMQDALHTQG